MTSVITSKYLMYECSRLGVNIQLLGQSLEAALLQAVDKVPQKLVSIFLPSLVEVSGYGTKVLDDGDWLHLSAARVEHSSTVAMELTHCTECLGVTCISRMTIHSMLKCGR